MSEKAKEKEMNVALFRGILIDYVVELENMCDIIIKTHFVKPDFRDQFIHFVLAKQTMNLNFKKEIVQFIQETNFPDLDVNPKFYANLKDLIDVRNDYAHRRFDVSERHSENENTYFLKYFKTKDKKMKIQEIPIDFETVSKHLLIGDEINKNLRKIIDAVHAKDV